MKVSFFEFHTRYTPRMETCLEIMQTHLDNGDEVNFYGCSGEMSSCESNFMHRKIICYTCNNKCQQGLGLLSTQVKYNSFIHLTPENLSFIKEERKRTFSTVSEIKTYTIDNFDIGGGILSSLVSMTRDPYTNIEKYRDVVSNLIESSLQVYFSVINHINEQRPDRIYLYNGRFTTMRAIMRACEYSNTSFYIHEDGSDINKYGIFENHLPHSIIAMTKNMNEAWFDDESVSREQKYEIANAFYTKRLRGIDYFSFTKNQQAELLPNNWDDTKDNIVIFNSSEDEFVSIGEEWEYSVYTSQLDAIEKVINSLKNNNNLHIYLRIHPFLAGVDNKSVTDLFTLKSDNLTIIPSYSKISTYTLLKKATKVISFGSTAGIEATYWDKVSISGNVNMYQYLDCAYMPKTHKELIDLLLNKDLLPKDKLGCLIYGYYYSSFGIEFNYYKPEELKSGKFKGKYLSSFPFSGYIPHKYRMALKSLPKKLGFGAVVKR
jgi:hypothetical protein